MRMDDDHKILFLLCWKRDATQSEPVLVRRLAL